MLSELGAIFNDGPSAAAAARAVVKTAAVDTSGTEGDYDDASRLIDARSRASRLRGLPRLSLGSSAPARGLSGSEAQTVGPTGGTQAETAGSTCGKSSEKGFWMICRRRRRGGRRGGGFVARALQRLVWLERCCSSWRRRGRVRKDQQGHVTPPRPRGRRRESPRGGDPRRSATVASMRSGARARASTRPTPASRTTARTITRTRSAAARTQQFAAHRSARMLSRRHGLARVQA